MSDLPGLLPSRVADGVTTLLLLPPRADAPWLWESGVKARGVWVAGVWVVGVMRVCVWVAGVMGVRVGVEGVACCTPGGTGRTAVGSKG